ncbi:LytR C-terminal domain-containing protein [Paenarthrobacter sp. DKR-5]|uniref:LytR C-terminal domain-containing protein n=1 Tax=Paenarthrobacter sp. DKR-5 TaxID=2835535 RepID=UPI001BDCE81B|nr:LytR C-terminal domain-containing protein [Paenarthrobacter sp. DKR-5]MBT1004334.1 LytR C-terminal domain-containing protein [Paenarthrobacter sp. DKR-5]
MTNFPRDEFDKVPETSSRQGVHRTRTELPGHGLTPVLIAGAVALVVGLASFFLLPRLGFGAASTGSTASAATSTTSASHSAPTPSAARTSAPASAKAPAQAAAPTPTPSASAAVDKTTSVTVLNASGVAGLGAKVAGQVQSAGWPVGSVANWQGQPQPSSVIFYNGAAQEGNAKALGALLNITRLVDTAEIGVPLAVVIGPGFS